MAFSSSPKRRIFSSESESACSAGSGGPGPTAAAGGGGWGGEGLAAGGGADDWGGAGGLAGGGVGPAAAAGGVADDIEDLPRRHSKCHIDQAAQQPQQPVTIDTTATATNISSQSSSSQLFRHHVIVGLNQKGVARIKSSFLYYDQQSQKFTEIY